MGMLRVAGVTCALLSCLPAWHGLAAIAESDYLGASLALGLTWVLARTGIELVALAAAAVGDTSAVAARAEDELGA